MFVHQQANGAFQFILQLGDQVRIPFVPGVKQLRVKPPAFFRVFRRRPPLFPDPLLPRQLLAPGRQFFLLPLDALGQIIQTSDFLVPASARLLHLLFDLDQAGVVAPLQPFQPRPHLGRVRAVADQFRPELFHGQRPRRQGALFAGEFLPAPLAFLP